MQNCLELGFEKLECRQMMAGDVTARITGAGDLVITGDSADNSVSATAMVVGGNSVIRLTGQFGTTVNGGSQIDLAEPARDLRVNLRGGDNRIDLTGVEGRRLNLRSGSGHDIHTLESAHFDELRGATGGGDDVVRLVRSEVGDSRVNTGSGDDLVIFTKLDGDTSRVSLGGGADTFSSTRSEHRGDFNLRAGSGEDAAASSRDNFMADARIDGGGSNDSLLAAWPGGESSINGEFSALRFESVGMPTTQQAYLNLVFERSETHFRFDEL